MKKNSKRIISVFLILTFVFLLFPSTFADDFTIGESSTVGESSPVVSSSGNCGDDVSYHLWNNGKLVLTGSGGIFDNAFKENLKITSVEISEGVTSIGNNVFEGCSALEYISLPASIKSIGNQAFYFCTGIEKIDVDTDNSSFASVDGVLFNKDKTALIQYPVGSKERSSYTFPESVTSIGDYAFSAASNLSSVSISEGVTSISKGCFAWSSNLLTEISIPVNVVSIESNAFEGCEGLENIVLPDYIEDIGAYAFKGCSALQSINIPTSVDAIEAYTFYNCSNLKDLVLPNGIKSIGDYAFCNCIKLEEFQTPLYTETIGEGALSWCSSLSSVTLSTAVESIGAYAFSNDPYIESFYIPESVTSIGDYAFFKCYKLEQIIVDEANPKFTSAADVLFSKDKTTLIQYPIGDTDRGTYLVPSSVKTISVSAFEYSVCLSKISIPTSVEDIQESAFANCTSLSTIVVNEANTKFTSADGVLFNKDKTTLIQYPVGNAETEYSIPSYVTSIGNSAFEGSKTLVKVVIPDGVTSIGAYAFFNCSLLTQISVPYSVENIGLWAMSWCNLNGIYLNSTKLAFKDKIDTQTKNEAQENELNIYSAEDAVGELKSNQRAAWFDAYGNILNDVTYGTAETIHAEAYTMGKLEKSSEDLTMADALMCFQYVANGKKNCEFWMPSADIDGNGAVSMLECMYMLMYLKGMTPTLVIF